MTTGTGRHQFHSNSGQPSFKMLLRKLNPSSSSSSRNYNHNRNRNPSKDLPSKLK
jgi:hypothetical protein